MSDRVYNTLFLCTGNSARSVMAECILNGLGGGRFAAFSAGSHPSGKVHPYTLDLLARLDHPTDGLRSKSWDEFAAASAPRMDFVFTVCDSAAGETCPIWPGQPVTAHWPFPDPVAFQGGEAQKRAFFAQVYGMIERRLAIFVTLPIATLDRMALRRRLAQMAQAETASTAPARQ